MALTAQQRTDLESALVVAYQYATLDQAFTYRMGRRLHEYVVDEGFSQVLFKLINITEQQGWTRRLIRIAVDRNQTNPELRSFIVKYAEYDRAVSRQEMLDLQIGFTEAFPTYPQLQAALWKRLETDIDAFAKADPNSAAWADETIPRVINWFDDIDQLDRLIEAILDENPANPVLRSKAGPVLKRLRKRAGHGPAEVNHFDACLLDGKIFINRKPLRDAVRVLALDSDTRVLAVSGPEGSGKTYSFTFFGHISEKQRAFNDAMKYFPEKEEVTANWWVKELCEFIIAEVKVIPGRKLLIVLDGFGHQDLHAETREMVKELVVRAASNTPLRVALLDYTNDLVPINASARVGTEVIEGFTRENVHDTLLKVARWHGEEPDPEVLDDMVEDVWSSVPATDKEHTRKIAEKVTEWVQQMARAAKEAP
jgi:hypothetical protein